MTTSEIVMCSIILFFAVFAFLIVTGIVKYIIDKTEERKNKDLELRKTELYTLIDPNKLNNLIAEWVHTYVQKYILTNMTIHNIEFINQDMTKLMIKEVSTQIILEMSDMHLTFLKLKFNMNKQEDLIKYVYNLVTDDVIVTVSDYNRSE